MKYIVVLWAFAIGLMVPLQGIINAKLGKEVGGPTQSLCIFINSDGISYENCIHKKYRYFCPKNLDMM